MQKLVVPLDGSALAESALIPAYEIARTTGAAVLLVTTRWDSDTETPQRYLGERAEALGLDRADTLVVFDRGPAEAILLEAHAGTETAVCMATHGRSGLGQAILGSVAEEVIRGARCPVLLVGPQLTDDWELPAAGTGGLLVCTDGSSSSEAIVPVAVRWAAALGLRIWLVQVLAPPNEIVAIEHSDILESAALQRLAGRLENEGVTAEWEILHGFDAADAIVDYAAELPASLIAMATHGRTGLARVALGSVAMKTAHKNPGPVLLVRPDDLTD